jgi:segregation and condensation protein B
VSDERPNSLAAQAASWVPPWERTPMAPDRDYQASVAEQGAASLDGPDTADQPDEDEERDEAGLTSDDDDFDEAFEGTNPPEYGEDVPPELPPLPGESAGNATVDAPTELDDDSVSPVEVGVGPDLAVPASIEQAVEAEEDEPGAPVDAPLPPDGDDAGDVFDAAADDDVGDGDDVDLPFYEAEPSEETTGEAPADARYEASSEGGDGEPAGTADEAPTGTSDEAPAGTADEAPAGTSDESPSGAGDGAPSGFLGVATDQGAGTAAAGAEAAAIPAQGRKSARPAAAPAEESARTPEVDLEERAPIDDAELRAALEAILLVVDEPVAEMQLAQILEEPTERVAAMLEDISARYTAAGHGFDLRRAAGGWRLYTRPEYAAYVERFVLDGQSVRLTQAALETLAVVAYKQPVTRSRISAIRGVNCDGVMRTLATRGLIEECGTESETGAFLYRTTGLFLEKLGLNSVDQLPPLAPFLPDDVEEVLDASG